MAGSRKGSREASRKRPKAPRWARLFVWIGAAVMVLSAGGAIGIKAVIWHYEGSVHRADLLGSARKNNEGRAVLNGAFNYLLLGSDVRAGDQDDTQGRSDTIMILHVTQDHKNAYLVSLPRDLWVHIGNCGTDNDPNGGTDPSSGTDPNAGGCMAKINAAYHYGGPQLTAKTVSDVSGVRFDGMAIVNFYSFDKIIDALGGVHLCVDEDTPSIHSGRTFAKGCYNFDGPTALDYVRQREEIGDGDYGRQRHQQQLIKAAVQQAEQKNLVTDPGKLDKIIKLAGNDLTVDSNGVDLGDLAYSLRNIGTSDISMLHLPENDAWSDDGQSIQQLDDNGKALFAAIQSDTLDQFSAQHPDMVNHDAA